MNPKAQKYKNGSYAMLPPELIESELFRKLSAKEIWVLIRFYQKIKRQSSRGRSAKLRISEILNNGQIKFPYSEAIAFGVSRTTFSRVIEKFVELGFIDIAEPGNPYAKTPTLYAVSDRWEKYNSPDFVEVRKNRVEKSGYGFQTGNKENPKIKDRCRG